MQFVSVKIYRRFAYVRNNVPSYWVITYYTKNGAQLLSIFVVCSLYWSFLKTINIENRRCSIQISISNSIIIRYLDNNYQTSPFAVVDGTLIKLASGLVPYTR